ncbi:MAG: EAL domain-containing protein [Aquaspirillum sp.]|nr:EAL domain-containing protein [Aquaspirillum sp.]
MNLADTASVALHPILLQRLRRGMLWFFLFLCVSTSIFIGWTILDHYQRTTADANARMVTLAKALETHIDASMQIVAAHMRVLAEDQDWRNAVRRGDEATAFSRLKQEVELLPQLTLIGAAGHDGRVLTSSLRYPVGQASVAERDFFLGSIRRTDDAAHLFRPAPAALNKSVIYLPLSMPLLDSTATRSEGVLVAGINPTYYHRFYRSLSLPENMTVDMVRDDGIRLIHHPQNTTPFGEDVRDTLYFRHLRRLGTSGLFEVAHDGKDMVYAGSRLSGFPLTVVVGLPKSQVLNDWYRDSLNRLLMAGLMIAAVGVSLYLLNRQIHRLQQSEEERQLAEQALVNSEQLLRLSLDAAETGLYRLDLKSLELTVDLDCLDWPDFDFSRHRYPLEEWTALVHPEDRWMLERVAQVPHNNQQHIRLEYRLHVGNDYHWVSVQGQFIDPDEHGVPQRQVGTINDIHRRKEAESRVAYNARFDALTGLANRYYLSERLEEAILRAQEGQYHVGVLFIDLDHFKNINDSLGHAVGDEVLKQVAARLADYLSSEDTLARLGGDEFLIVLPRIQNEREAVELAGAIVTAMSMPVVVDGRELTASSTVGISIYPRDGEQADVLIRNADAAMYQAKARGRNNFGLYTPSLNADAAERLELESQLRTAHLRGELRLFYQPQVDAQTGVVIGAEALMRWVHPELGMISPGKFIPIAESSGLIVPMGTWALNEACRQSREWQEAGLPDLTIAVNLSSLQFQQANFVDLVADALRESGIRPSCLELELTESIVMFDVDQVVAIIDQLKLLGIQLSIDDFGTGYSSLSYLKRFNVDKLKIDQSFVRDLPGNSSDAAIVRAMIALGRNLHLKLIAEGVETAEQAAFLAQEGADELQGYYFAKPMPAAQFADFLAQNHRQPH